MKSKPINYLLAVQEWKQDRRIPTTAVKTLLRITEQHLEIFPKTKVGLSIKEKAMSDVTRYIEQRSRRDPEFAEDLEQGYTDFKLQAHCTFDYSKAKPNRFAERLTQESVAVVLDPDVAAVFKNEVNTISGHVLRKIAEEIKRG